MDMKSIELFAGAGGLALGLDKSGVAPSAVIEWDKDACDTLRENARHSDLPTSGWNVQQSDIRLFDFAPYVGKVDLVSGGPPCQPFSIGGKHQGAEDARDMFPEAARVVRLLQPKAFIFENVRGLLRQSFAKYFQYILLQLTYPYISPREGEIWTEHLSRLEAHHTSSRTRDGHYRVVFRRVNAADYGVPQKRERVVMVGFRSDIGEDWSFPKETHSEESLLHAKWVSGDYWEEHRVAKKDRLNFRPSAQTLAPLDPVLKLARWRTVRDAISDLPPPSVGAWVEIKNHRSQPGAKIYTGHTGSPIDEPAKTLKAGGHGVPGGENMLALPNGDVRYFTVRESARLQTFPDWYYFPGSWTESMRQIGNAVPVRLAEAIGKSVVQVLKRHNRRSAA
jgi:DNA (cytosine-5)-methyltransferase 1